MIKRVIIFIAIFSISIFSITPLVRPQYDDQIELISLDLKDTQIMDVLKILSQKSGLNIVADNDVKGKVSLYVKDVDVMDALDIIVSTNELAYVREGSLIRIMADGKYEKLHGRTFEGQTKTEIVKLDYISASDAAESIREIKTELGKVISDERSNTLVLIDNPEAIKRMKDAISGIDVPLATEIFSLGYAKADSIKEKLEQMVSDGSGTIKFDERTNKVVVETTPNKMKDIRNIVEAFDEKTREVIIDASIIKVTLSDKYSYGIDWADVAKIADVTLTGNSNLTTSLTGTTPSALTIATTGGNYSTVISLLKTFGKTNVLSRPRIIVADKEEAYILVGSKEVYVTSDVTTTSGGTYHTTDHVQFVDVGVKLSVTPEINKEGYVRMKIRPEVSDVDSTKTVTLTNPDASTRSVIPYITTSEAETTLLVKDNTTIILGGLMKDTLTKYNDKVPFLGDIPLLGKLFSTRGKGKEKTELVIFITPHIIEGDKTTEEAEFYLDEWGKKEKESDEQSEVSKVKSELPEEVKPESPEKVKSKPQKKVKSKLPKKEWTPVSFIKSKNKKVEQKSAKEIAKKSVSEAIGGKTPYEEYYFTVREEINNAAASQDVEGAIGEVEVQFTLDKEGFLTRGPVVLNKPDLKLVRAAVNCVKQISPFSPFPKTMRNKEENFYVVLRYE